MKTRYRIKRIQTQLIKTRNQEGRQCLVQNRRLVNISKFCFRLVDFCFKIGSSLNRK